ncbi:glycosyltransferase [Erythrobacter sp. THAF29]|uniref:glycosyltransferase family 2 protein n=1 Tax=Erythrobacter sp. THAF29 TaxID=2587851 RepID=UPI00126801D6|nr:glycosyltransferase [Erythrobacter sp. THAF29]QFT75969.1 N-glycosyltransferase [Erythrobacter sp. THAF29]
MKGSSGADATPFTVVIPAFNEETVISACLESVFDGMPLDANCEVIVVANGCRDRTADIARAFDRRIRVIEIAQGSKTNAINQANRAATRAPRIFLDADVKCDYRSLSALAKILGDPDVLAAVPQVRIDTDGADALVKAYYRVWLRQPFAASALGGTGCFGLSARALRKLGSFPEIIADDLWAMSRFPPENRRIVTSDDDGNPVYSTVTAPKSFLSQIRVESRRHSGSLQVRREYPTPNLSLTGKATIIPTAKGSGTSTMDAAIFLAMKAAARLKSKWRAVRGAQTVWTRDLSTRMP